MAFWVQTGGLAYNLLCCSRENEDAYPRGASFWFLQPSSLSSVLWERFISRWSIYKAVHSRVIIQYIRFNWAYFEKYSVHYIAGIVNLKPIVPGHVLLIPKRVCARFADLTEDEVCDLYLCAHRIVSKLEKHYNCSSVNIAMQDGADAGRKMIEKFLKW